MSRFEPSCSQVSLRSDDITWRFLWPKCRWCKVGSCSLSLDLRHLVSKFHCYRMSFISWRFLWICGQIIDDAKLGVSCFYLFGLVPPCSQVSLRSDEFNFLTVFVDLWSNYRWCKVGRYTLLFVRTCAILFPSFIAIGWLLFHDGFYWFVAKIYIWCKVGGFTLLFVWTRTILFPSFNATGQLLFLDGFCRVAAKLSMV